MCKEIVAVNWARSHNRGKRLFLSSYPSVHLYAGISAGPHRAFSREIRYGERFK